jgi:hypothetical protein
MISRRRLVALAAAAVSATCFSHPDSCWRVTFDQYFRA